MSVTRGPGSCPLIACEVLIPLQVPAKLLLVTVVFEQLVPLELGLQWSLCVDNLFWLA